MNDKQAERVSYLLALKKKLQDSLREIKLPDIEFRINFRFKGGMYDGHPSAIIAEEYELSQKQISEYIGGVLQNKLDVVSKELEGV